MAENDRMLVERLDRILMSIALEKPDRVPVVLEYSGFAAYVTGTQMAEFLASPAKNLETMIQAYHRVAGADAINYGSFWPYGLCYTYLSKVSVPGVDLPEDEMWQRFVWPYFSRLVREVVDAGLIALLHLDSNWTRELERFKELPQARCIMALDGETDIFKAKEILGDHMCIMGDVPASMLYLDTPDIVYDYCIKLIRELGPEGFILQSGCDIPANAKLENVKAMVSAALDS